MEEEAFELAQTALTKLKIRSDSCMDFFDINSRLGRGTIKLMKDQGFITLRNEADPRSIADITSIGIKVEKTGVAKYMYNLKALEAEKDSLTLRKLKIDVKNAERVHSTYWYTFFIAIIALLISIINLVNTLTNPIKEPKQKVNTKPALNLNLPVSKSVIHHSNTSSLVPIQK